MSLNSVTESTAKEKQPIKLRLFVLKELAHSSELADLLLKQLTLNGCVGLLEDAWVAVREQDARESGYLMSSQVTGNALRTPQREQPRASMNAEMQAAMPVYSTPIMPNAPYSETPNRFRTRNGIRDRNPMGGLPEVQESKTEETEQNQTDVEPERPVDNSGAATGGGMGLNAMPTVGSSTTESRNQLPSGLTPMHGRMQARTVEEQQNIKTVLDFLKFKADSHRQQQMPGLLSQKHETLPDNSRANALIKKAIDSTYIWCHSTFGYWESHAQRKIRMAIYDQMSKALKHFPTLTKNVILGDIHTVFCNLVNAGYQTKMELLIELQAKFLALKKLPSMPYADFYVQFTDYVVRLSDLGHHFPDEMLITYFLMAMDNDSRYKRAISQIKRSRVPYTLMEVHHEFEVWAKDKKDLPKARTKKDDGDASANVAGVDDTPVCFQWRDKGRCRFGDKCRYSHDDKKKGKQASKSKTAENSGKKGKSKKDESSSGDDSPPVQSQYKECRNWAKDGACPRGKNCRFLHGGKKAAEASMAIAEKAKVDSSIFFKNETRPLAIPSEPTVKKQKHCLPEGDEAQPCDYDFQFDTEVHDQIASEEEIIKPIFLLDWMNHSPVEKLLHEQIRSYYLDSPANDHAVDDDCVYYQSESESKHAQLYASQQQYNALLCDVFVLGDLHLPLWGGGMELELEQKISLHRESNSVHVLNDSALPTELCMPEWNFSDEEIKYAHPITADAMPNYENDTSGLFIGSFKTCQQKLMQTVHVERQIDKKQTKVFKPGSAMLLSHLLLLLIAGEEALELNGIQNSNKALAFMTEAAFNVAQSNDDKYKGKIMCVDSGATHAMLPDRPEYLKYIVKGSRVYETQFIGTAEDAKKLCSEFHATICIRQKRNKEVFLKNVLFVKDLAKPLISVGMLADDGYEITFSRKVCKMRRYHQTFIVGQRVRNGLYVLPETCLVNEHERESNEPQANLAQTYTGSDQKELLHCRLGHYKHADSFAEKGTGDGKHAKHFCAACIRAKAHRKPFSKVRQHKSLHTLHNVHMDTCGPFPFRDAWGNKHFTCMLDAYSEYAAIVPHKTKDSLFAIAKSFVQKAERQQQPNKVVNLHSDGAGATNRFLSWVVDTGITMILTAPGSSESNGKVERLFRTLQESGNAMRRHANGPESLAMQSFILAAIIRNHMPHKRLPKVKDGSRYKAPVEIWEKFEAKSVKQLLGYFRVFLCECFVVLDAKKVAKGRDRTERCVWVRPDYAARGRQLCYSLEQPGKWWWARTIYCNETCLPFRDGMKLPQQLKGSGPAQLVHHGIDHQGEEEPEVEPMEISDGVDFHEAQKDLHSEQEEDSNIKAAYEYLNHDEEDESENVAKPEPVGEDTALERVGKVYKQSYFPAWGPVEIVAVEKKEYDELGNPMPDEFEVKWLKYPRSRNSCLKEDELGEEITQTHDGYMAAAMYAGQHAAPSLGSEKADDVLAKNAMLNQVVNDSMTWRGVWHNGMLLPSHEFELDEGNKPEAMLATSAKPAARGSATNPKVGMTVAHDVDAALPRFHFQTRGHPLEAPIRDAEVTEFQTLYNQGVFKKLSRTESDEYLKRKKEVIDLIWVYKAKADRLGFFEKIKARLALRGDQERRFVMRTEAYAPVMAQVTMKALMSLHAADLSVDFHHGDVTAAFVSSEMRRHVVVKLPSHLVKGKYKDRLFKIEKALYGGVDAGRCFYDDWLDYHVNTLGFKSVHYDKCYLFKQKENGDFIKLAFHVDDSCYASKGKGMWKEYTEQIQKRFEVKFGVLEHFLGIDIQRCKKTGAFTLSLASQVDKMLKVFHMDSSNSARAPPPGSGVVPTLADVPDDEPSRRENAERIPQQQAVGHLQYLQNTLYPELSYSVKIASKFNKAPCDAAWTWIKGIFRWLKKDECKPYVIRGGEWKNMTLTAWSDSNHAKDVDGRKSLGGYVIKLWGDLIDYGSFTQPIVSHSSSESELIALDMCARRVQYIVWLLEAMCGKKLANVPIYIDNNSTLEWSRDSPFSPSRNCHVHARYFYVRDLQREGVVNVLKCDTADNLADLMVTFKSNANFYSLSSRIKGGRLELPKESQAVKNNEAAEKAVKAKKSQPKSAAAQNSKKE